MTVLDLTADIFIVLLHSGVKLALDTNVRGQRNGFLGLEVLQDDIWLAYQQLVPEDVSDSIHVDLVELVVVKWRLEPAQALEDLQDLTLRVPMLDLRVLAGQGRRLEFFLWSMGCLLKVLAPTSDPETIIRARLRPDFGDLRGQDRLIQGDEQVFRGGSGS